MNARERRLFIPVIEGGASVPFADKVTALTPFLWWKMNEASGTAITDYGSGSHNGTFTAGSGALGQTGIGDGGTAIEFDGSATQIAVAGNPALTAPAAGTVAVWMKFLAATWTDGAARIIRFDRADNANYFRIGRTVTNNILGFDYRAGGGTAISLTMTANTTTDWFLFAGTWDGTGTAAYQVLKGGATVVKNTTGGASGSWSAGAALWQMGYAGAFLDGAFAHMMIFPSKLTEAQLVNLATI